ncbi:MFS transporter [Pilimelia columellifera]|uniref:MFS transporter n=1 Tax=Pilimelia columellifera subsp. columellifera TaxID=706583 RepID=A0ABN3NBX9_9ACTN
MVLPRILHPLSLRNYRLWAGADIVSVAGAWMQIIGINLLVLQLTGSAAAMGVSVLLSSLPTILLGGWGGALADRLPVRPVLLACQVIRMLTAFGLAGAVATGVGGMTVVYGCAVVGGVVTAVEGPALGRFGATLVPAAQLGTALGLGSMISSGGRIAGVAVAGALAASTGTATLFLINGISFVLVIAAVVAVRTAELFDLTPGDRPSNTDAAGPRVGSFREGVRYLAAQRTLIVALGLAFLLGSLGRNYQVTMAAMADGPLAAGAAGYGMLSTAFGVGALVGGIAVASRAHLTWRLFLITGAGMSALQALSAFSDGVVMFALLMALIGAAAVVVDTIIATRLQLDTPPRMRGRMLGILGITSAAGSMLGAPILGWLCDTIGPAAALELAGIVTLAGAGAAALGMRRWRLRLWPQAAAASS